MLTLALPYVDVAAAVLFAVATAASGSAAGSQDAKPEPSRLPAASTRMEPVVVGQGDEIATMQQWLRDRGRPVPDATATKHKMKMNGMEHEMLMPGMMTDEQMAALDQARGPEFDRLFLEGMIRHHQGAIDMVDVLFKSHGAAQDEVIYRFASDVYADQSTEIARMQKMLGDK